MVILLGITLELATVIGSIILPINATTDTLLDIANKGCKVNKKAYDEVQKKLDEEKKEITTPMTDEEKEEYANIEKKIEKLAYIGKMCLTNDFEENIDESEKEQITQETTNDEVNNKVQANIMLPSEIVTPLVTEETTMEEGPKLTMKMNTKKKY